MKKEQSLSSVIQLFSGGTPKTNNHEYWNGSIPWLSVADFNSGRKYVYKTEKMITEQGLEGSSTQVLKKGSIIISARGTVGALAVLCSPMAFNQSCYGITGIDNLTLTDYIYYYLKYSLNDLQQMAHGGVFSTITRETFDNIKISLPSLPEQRAIASVLSSLDDKIDLLHRQNATLEAMAEALFKKWFVVEAKEEWEEKPLSTIADFLNGLPCQRFRPKNFIDRLPVLKIRELSQGIDSNSEWATTDVPESYIIKTGDIIFSWSGSLMVKIWFGKNCILNQHLYKVYSAKYPKWYYYFWCIYHLREFIMIADSKSTTMGHIKRSDLDNALVLVPSAEELTQMNEKIVPFFNKILNNQAQITTLEKLRDSLLPKLMSGEVRVKY